MARPITDERKDACGTFKRGSIYWQRWTENGKQHFRSLGTSDVVVAIQKARLLEESRVEKRELQGFENELEAYINRRDFAKTTKETVRSAAKAFLKFKRVNHPSEVEKGDLQKFYDWYLKQESYPRPKPKKKDGEAKEDAEKKTISQSTAQNYVSRIETFLHDIGVSTKKVIFSDIAEPRTTVATHGTFNYLIARCASNIDCRGINYRDLAFILYCTFHMGMRKGEIIMCRPDWVHIDGSASKIKIPSRDSVTGWQPKNKRAREIPINSGFLRWLVTYEGEWRKQPFMIAPANIGKNAGQRYRYDYRRPFKDFVTTCGHPEITPHVGRHSFVTHCIQDKMEINTLAYITGDRRATLEKHYIHAQASQSDLNSALDKA